VAQAVQIVEQDIIMQQGVIHVHGQQEHINVTVMTKVINMPVEHIVAIVNKLAQDIEMYVVHKMEQETAGYATTQFVLHRVQRVQVIVQNKYVQHVQIIALEQIECVQHVQVMIQEVVVHIVEAINM